MNQVRVIKSDQEHEQALARLMSLMDSDPKPGSAEADELDVLALVIEHYERENFPIDPPDPVDAIKFRMDQQGLSQRDLIPFIGSASKVSEVLSHKRSLSLNMVRRISEGLGIPAEVLIRESSPVPQGSERLDTRLFPLKEMFKRGYFPSFTGTVRDLPEYGEELLHGFINSVRNGYELKPALLRSSAGQSVSAKQTDIFALWMWQVRVLQRAQAEKLSIRFEPETINLDTMRRLAQLSWSENGPQLAKEYLGRYGVHLVYERHLPKTYLDGAVCRDGNRRPIVALTLRYKRVDCFWFTLMHELAHVALHLEKIEGCHTDDLDAPVGNEGIELEANLMAQDALIPSDIWQSDKPSSATEVRKLGERLNIHPCIIAGRLRHEEGNHSKFGTAFRDEISL